MKKSKKQPTKPVAIKSAVVNGVKIVRTASGAIEFHILKPLGLGGIKEWKKENAASIRRAIANFDHESLVVTPDGNMAIAVEDDMRQPIFGHMGATAFIDPSKVKYDANSLNP